MNFGSLETARSALRVSYLTSSAFGASLAVIHFYQLVEQTQNTNRAQKRILILVDRPTYQSEIDTAIHRCVMMSKIEEMMIQDEHLRPLTGPFCEYDVLLQQCSMLDFIRTIGAIYKPNNTLSVNIPLYELEENQPIAGRVNVRLSTNSLRDVPGTTLSEVAIKTLQESNTREVGSLKEALQRQKDEQLMELVDLHTQNESLKHSLTQTEQYMMAVKRCHREEREQLLGRVSELEQHIKRFQSLPSQVPYPYPTHSQPTSTPERPPQQPPIFTSQQQPQLQMAPSPVRQSADLMDKLERDLRFGSDYLTRLQMRGGGADSMGPAAAAGGYGTPRRDYPTMEPQYMQHGVPQYPSPIIKNVQFAPSAYDTQVLSPRSRYNESLTRPAWK